MPRKLQQASQMSMLELSKLCQENNEERKRMEAETDKIYKEFQSTYFSLSKKSDEHQAAVDAMARKYNASLMKEKEIKTYKPMVIRTMRRTWLAE